MSTALWWKGNTWKINVVGIRKSNKKTEPIFWFFPKIKNPEPKLRHIIAPTKRIDEIGLGIPFEEIYSTVPSNPFILLGMAEINIAEINTLEKKSKKDLALLFLKIEFFIIIDYKKILEYFLIQRFTLVKIMIKINKFLKRELRSIFEFPS